MQAVVIDNLIQRTLYFGVRLLLPSPFPSKVFAQLDAAEAWLHQELGGASDVPPQGSSGPGHSGP